mgnify:CR=1 FL=1
MSAYQRPCRLILLTLLISSLSACQFGQKDSNFQWLDISAVPRASTEIQFQEGATFEDLASAYIMLKHECRATNNGVDQLEYAQKKLRKLQ